MARRASRRSAGSGRADRGEEREVARAPAVFTAVKTDVVGDRIVDITIHRHDAMSDPTPDSPSDARSEAESEAEIEAARVGGPIAKAFYVLMAVPTLAFTGYNLWRLLFDGELWIRNRGRFVPPDGSLYFWVTLLFYVLMFFMSLIVLALFCGWVVGRLRRRG